MAVHTINKGLDLPITGAPEQKIVAAAKVTRVAIVAADYPGMKPRMHVKVGDSVKRGDPLFDDRKSEGVTFTSPGAGKVVAINRGEFRALQSVVVELSASEREGKPAPDEFRSFAAFKAGMADDPSKLGRDEVVALLAESGLWSTIRARPHGRVPAIKSAAPHSIFVTAMDSNPLAAGVDVVMSGREKDFERGLAIVARLTPGKLHLCKAPGGKVPSPKVANLEAHEFAGPHPAGTVGLHIHLVDPVDRNKIVWHLGYQDVIAIGRLFATGKLDVERVVSLAGPTVKKPRLLLTRAGAFIDEIVVGELQSVENRVVSGSVLSGRKAMGEQLGYLGRYHLQISALREGREREFLGWMTPGTDKFSTSGAYVSALTPGKKFDFTTALNGSHRYMVPIGMFERVFPFDILPTFLLRALLIKDLTRAEELGVLELDEEDVALCTFVCPGKQDYGPILRDNLDTIWKEG
ncbi:Na(+)-translocating NADH-quinone reductase subunit A [Nannocystaceae bacterium ST9]